MVQNIFNHRLKTINAESFQTDAFVLHERSSAHNWRSSVKSRLWFPGLVTVLMYAGVSVNINHNPLSLSFRPAS